jgi:TldD protein
VTTTQATVDDNYPVLRRAFWLATDRAYKTAVEAIARKRSALKNITQNETLPDFWKAPPVEIIAPARASPDLSKWSDTVRKLSTIFTKYPDVLASSVTFDASNSTFRMRNSEGTNIRMPDSLFLLQVGASGKAADGTNLRDSVVVPRLDANAVPPLSELEAAVQQVAENVKNLTQSPVAEAYSGPVLIEKMAAAQIMAELLAPNVVLSRRPVGEPGRPVPFVGSEFEGRIGSKVLPEFLDVIDDPTQSSWDATALLGHYKVDEEGVLPQPVTLIEKGRMKGFLLTRQPVKGFTESNGRARMPGPYGARAASISNLFVRSSESVSSDALRAKLIEMIQARSKPYGIIIRKMDYPSSASGEEIRRLLTTASQSGSARPVSSPILAYRVYPDGKEELVRGLRFRNLTARSLRDILAVSDESYALHFLYNLAPMSLIGAGGYVAPSSVIAPSLLFEDLELERSQDDTPKPSVVPPPVLSSAQRSQ